MRTWTLQPLPSMAPRVGLYFRPGRNDGSAVFGQLLHGHDLSGLVIGASLTERLEDVRLEARRNALDVVLDPLALELSFRPSFSRPTVSSLPWAGTRPDRPEDLRTRRVKIADSIADFAIKHAYSAVIAPTHFIESPSDPWFAEDRALTRALRAALDVRGATELPIYYRLAVPGKVLRDDARLLPLIGPIAELDVDALWIRVHGFGTTNSGPHILTQYIRAGRALLATGLPILAENTGTIGIALAAFGPAGGIESGITFGERFDVMSMRRPPRPGEHPFAPQPRVYLHEIATFADAEDARILLASRPAKALLGCRDTTCCPLGISDMLSDPKRHFIRRRTQEVGELAVVPPEMRAAFYLEKFLRPASDRAVKAARISSTLDPVRQRLDSWRVTLSAIEARDAAAGQVARSNPATGGRHRRQGGALAATPRLVE